MFSRDHKEPTRTSACNSLSRQGAYPLRIIHQLKRVRPFIRKGLHTLLIGLFGLFIAGCSLLGSSSNRDTGAAKAKPLAYTCSNDIEVQCDIAGCEAKQDSDFTPMHAEFDNAGNLEICAYSGCWKGKAEVWQTKKFLFLSGEQIPFTSGDVRSGHSANIALSVELGDHIAIVKVDAFTQPLFCKTK